MNRYPRLLTAGIVAWLLILPAWAGIADDISIPVFKQLRFSPDAIAIVLPQGVYKINRKPGIAEAIDQQTLATEITVAQHHALPSV